jgi:uncharacterized protein (TIGR00251 family)
VHNAVNLKETKDGILLPIFVKPNSPKFKIELDGTQIIVYATEEPERGKVNKEIIKAFSKLFHGEVTLVGGFTSRQKKLLIKGLSKQQLEETFAAP